MDGERERVSGRGVYRPVLYQSSSSILNIIIKTEHFFLPRNTPLPLEQHHDHRDLHFVLIPFLYPYVLNVPPTPQASTEHLLSFSISCFPPPNTVVHYIYITHAFA